MAEPLAKVPERVVRLPPGRDYIVVPIDSRSAALAGISMLSACDRNSLLAQSALYWTVRLLGPWVVPGRRGTWTPPVSGQDWNRLVSSWRIALGEFDAIALYDRPQASRDGLVITLVAGRRPIAVVKMRRGAQRALAHESSMLSGLPKSIDSVRVPRLLAKADQADTGVSWLAMSAVSSGVHRPYFPKNLKQFTRHVSDSLRECLPKPDSEVATHWQPAHGDLTPWNLRSDRRGPFLIDWEDACWAPPHTDEVYFRAVAAAVGIAGVPAWTPDQREARDYLLRQVLIRSATDEDSALTTRLAHILRA